MRMSLIVQLVLVTCAILVAGCGGDPTYDDVVGTYVQRYDFGAELLRLKVNGEYLQVIILDQDTIATSNTGTWEFDSRNRSVRLERGRRIDDGFGRLRADYMVPVPGTLVAGYYRRWLGRASLVNNEDVGLAYMKIE